MNCWLASLFSLHLPCPHCRTCEQRRLARRFQLNSGLVAHVGEVEVVVDNIERLTRGALSSTGVVSADDHVHVRNVAETVIVKGCQVRARVRNIRQRTSIMTRGSNRGISNQYKTYLYQCERNLDQQE